MAQVSYARRLLEYWGISVEDIPTSDSAQKQEADFIATFGTTRVLIEEKTKEDNAENKTARAQQLESGEIYAKTIPLVRNEQFMATLYGRTNIFEMNSEGYRRCYFFRNSDFHRRASVVDGAIVAYTHGNSISAKLCLNPLSPSFSELRKSPIIEPFGTAIEDPIELESDGTAFILDTDLNRKNEGPLLAYLQEKYSTRPLMKIDLGYTGASILVQKDDA